MTRLFAVLGHPVSHSLSPAMHQAAFRALGLDAVYTAVDTPPASLRPILKALALAGVDGLNVTVPLKEAVIPLLDRVEMRARAIGAVNTILIRGRRTIGHNTDGVGLLRALRELGWPACAAPGAAGRRPRAARVVLLGAGGASRAAAWELSRIPGLRLTIANRRPERARGLAQWLCRQRPGARVEAVSLRQAPVRTAALLINATTLGMKPSDPLPIDPSKLQRGAVVYDLVYHRQTPLVRAARRRGCVAANGLSMLLYQGAESFRLWTGRRPPIDVMRRALIHAVNSHHPV